MMNPMTKQSLLRNLLVARYFKPNKEEQGISLLLALMMGLVLITGATGLLIRQQMTRKIGSSESYQQMAETAASNGFNRIISELNNDRPASYRGYLYAIENRCLDPVDAPAECEPSSDHYYWSLLGSKAVPVGLGELCANTSAGLPVHPEGSQMVWPTDTVPFSKDKTETLRDDGKKPIQTFYRLRSYRPELGKSGNGQGRFSVEGLVKRVGAEDNEYLARTLLTRTLSIETKVPEVAVMASRHFNLGPARINGPGVIIVDVATTDGFPAGCNATNLLNIVKGNNSNQPDLGSHIWPVLERGMLSPVFYEGDDTKDKEPDGDLDRIWSFDDSAKGASGCEDSVVCTSSHANGKPKKPEGVEITGSWGGSSTGDEGAENEVNNNTNSQNNSTSLLPLRGHLNKFTPANRDYALKRYESAKAQHMNSYNRHKGKEKLGYQKFCKEAFDPNTPLSGKRIDSGRGTRFPLIESKRRLYGGLGYTSKYFIVCSHILNGSIPKGSDIIDAYYSYKAPETSSLSERRKKERADNIRKFQAFSASKKEQQRNYCAHMLRSRQNSGSWLDLDQTTRTCGDFEAGGMERWSFSQNRYQPTGSWYYKEQRTGTTKNNGGRLSSSFWADKNLLPPPSVSSPYDYIRPADNQLDNRRRKERNDRASSFNRWRPSYQQNRREWCQKRLNWARKHSTWWDTPDVLKCGDWGMWKTESESHAKDQMSAQELAYLMDKLDKAKAKQVEVRKRNNKDASIRNCTNMWGNPNYNHRQYNGATGRGLQGMSPTNYLRINCYEYIYKDLAEQLDGTQTNQDKEVSKEAEDWVIKISKDDICKGKGDACHLYVENINLKNTKVLIENDGRPVVIHLVKSTTVTNAGSTDTSKNQTAQSNQANQSAPRDQGQGAHTTSTQQTEAGIFKIEGRSSFCGVDQSQESCNEKPERLVFTSTDGDDSLTCDKPSNLELTIAGQSLPSAWISLPKGRIQLSGDASMRGVIWADNFCSQGNALKLTTKQKNNADESVIEAADSLWDLNRHTSFKAYGRSITRGVRGNLFDIFKRW